MHTVLASLFLLVGVQDLQEGLVGLRLVAKALLDGSHVGDGVVELGGLRASSRFCTR